MCVMLLHMAMLPCGRKGEDDFCQSFSYPQGRRKEFDIGGVKEIVDFLMRPKGAPRGRRPSHQGGSGGVTPGKFLK